MTTNEDIKEILLIIFIILAIFAIIPIFLFIMFILLPSFVGMISPEPATKVVECICNCS